ncbi:MAG: lipoprotein-releasing ABC transporter permease subunit [Deltaproteobacteria bacterium]|nr:lipoprotein-releasing ABC transporter permease subunit [Deltaproteobacteria bacterium]
MYFELFLAVRYLKAKRKQAFISIISVISVAGVMAGVMALIVVLSVMNGFRADLTSKIMSVNSHILIRNYLGSFDNYNETLDAIKKIKGVVAVTPSIYDQVMVTSSGGYSTGAALRGVDIKSAGDVMDIENMVKEGRLSSLEGTYDGKPGVIIGIELAKYYGISLGDEIKLTAPQGKVTPLKRIPNSKEYLVTGLFNSGMYEYDQLMVFVSNKEAQDLLGIDDRITNIEVKVKDPEQSDVVGDAINEALDYQFYAQDWKKRNRSLFSALRLEKYTMFIILTMIILVGALNIISSLVMVVIEKARDVAILRAMGATKKSIMRVFMLQGLFVGIAGTLGGLIAGLGICELIKKIPISLPSDIYYIDRLPVSVDYMDVSLVTLAAVVIAFLATIYPSWHASRMNPVEALRYE